MIGQEHIVKTLTNQIVSGRIGHAYLFCGTRGTGKTTTAKIFARAINCEHPVNGSPCGECATCKALSDPANLDIVEMDAASNNKVENVREIRDKVQYPPVAGKYKVYIIDEVHMLTTEAFNALLKTLEEPPAHAVFILATTEQHKLPATILSRCMRFDFKLVPDKQIAALIERIYKEVGKDYEKEAVMKIALSGEGCVRDALSVADLCLSFSDKKLTYNDVIDVLGVSDNQSTYELIGGIFASDSSKAMTVTEEACSSGKSVGLMCKDIQNVLHDVLIVKTCKNHAEVLSLPESEFSQIKALADLTDKHRMLRILEIFSAIENDLKYSTHPKMVFQTAVLKATLPSEDYNIDALIGRVAQLEKQLGELMANGIKVPVSVDYQHNSAENKRHDEAKNSTEKEAVKEEIAPVTAPAKEEQTSVETRSEQIQSKTKTPTAPETKTDTGERKRGASDIGAQIDSFFEGEGLPEPPPEDEDASGFIMTQMSEEKKSLPEQNVSKPEQNRSVNEGAAPVSQPKSFNAARTWGRLLRRLRADKNIMLWIACQDAETSVSGENFVVLVEGDNEYNLLTKPENMKILQNLLSEECMLRVVVRKKGMAGDNFDDDIKAVKDVLGDVDVIE